MHPMIGHFFGRLTRVLPNITAVQNTHIDASFFVPSFNHHVGADLARLRSGRREPHLYDWINRFPADAVFFDVGTNYGQEVVWAATQKGKNIRVVGFDCSMVAAHICGLNKALNNDRFDFVFAAIGAQSGGLVEITANSDTHIPRLHKKNVPYRYHVPTLSLGDYAADHGVVPTHLKIDVDGAEPGVIAGAAPLLANPILREIFIEIDAENADLVHEIERYGFQISWHQTKQRDAEYLFVR